MPNVAFPPQSASGGVGWVNPTNALTLNGAFAVKTSSTQTLLALDCANAFGDLNTVQGIAVTGVFSAYWDWPGDPFPLPAECWVGLEIGLSTDGATLIPGTSWKNEGGDATGGPIGANGHLASFGGPSDLWGAAEITAEEIQSLKILIRRRPAGDGSGVQHLAVDYAEPTVYYSAGSAGDSVMRETKKQLNLVAIEDTAGTAETSGFYQLTKTKFSFDPAPEYRKNKPGGEKSIDDNIHLREITNGSIEGEVTFDELGLLLASCVCIPSTFELNASPLVNRHQFRYDNRYRDDIHTLTMQKGDPRTECEQVAFGIINSLDLNLSGQDTTLSGTILARIMDENATLALGAATVQTLTLSGTVGFKLVFKGQATAALSQASTAAEIQTALRALAAVASSTQLTVTGSTGGPYTITFGNAIAGPFKGEPQPMLEVQKTSGAGSGAVAMTTVGGYTKYAGKVVKPKFIDVYMADAHADLAAGKLTRCFVSSVKLGARAEPHYTLDTDNNGSFADYTEPDSLQVTLELSHEADDTGKGLIDKSRSGEKIWLRILATGEEITSGFPRQLMIEAPFFIDIKPIGDEQGVFASTYTLTNTFSTENNEMFVLELDNEVASYAAA